MYEMLLLNGVEMDGPVSRETGRQGRDPLFETTD
jgi:hypothetical protein